MNMRRIKLVAAAVICVGLGVSQGKALPFSNPVYQDVDAALVFLSSGQSYSGVFDITQPDSTPSFTVPSGFANSGHTYSDVVGFQPGISDPIRSASAFFYIGGVDWNELIEVNLGGVLTTGTGYIGSVLLENGLSADLLVLLNATGQLEYTVSNIGGGRYALKGSQLQVTVPDGGTTSIMLGSVLLGLAAVRGKLRTVR